MQLIAITSSRLHSSTMCTWLVKNSWFKRVFSCIHYNAGALLPLTLRGRSSGQHPPPLPLFGPVPASDHQQPLSPTFTCERSTILCLLNWSTYPRVQGPRRWLAGPVSVYSIPTLTDEPFWTHPSN